MCRIKFRDLTYDKDYYVMAETLARSAADNNITPEEFKHSLDNLSHASISSLPQIQAWRDEATELYFKYMEEEGKLTMHPEEFLGGSDFGDDEDDPSDCNKNFNFIKE